jgi:Uma2 family endonuclease
MLMTSNAPATAETDGQQFVIPGVSWEAYVAFSDALGERRYPRMVYCAGRLTFMGKTRHHEWLSECLGNFVLGVAGTLGLECEPSGEATCRRREKEAGLEGDRTFHFGPNARLMRGPKNYDFEVDPPPDLAIEVEVIHAADDAIVAWGRLGVPEVWRFDARRSICTFWSRRDDGTYQQVPRSSCLPLLTPVDVVKQMKRAQEIGTAKWRGQLDDWVRKVIRPRRDKSGPGRCRGGR